MSASDKKKLRKEQAAAVLSERQRHEQAEAKKLKIYTVTFITAMVLVVCVALGVLGVRAVNQSGILQKNTIAATIGDRELDTVELSYYYHDVISDFYNQWYEQYSSYTDMYLQMMGLDASKPLNEQIHDEESGKTWADYFIDAAISRAQNDFALYDLAMKEGFTLPEEERTELDNTINNLGTYAELYGYKNADQYLSAAYGHGSDVKSYGEYSERSAIATAYYNAHEDSLVYEDAAIREYEADKKSNYDSYTFTQAYLSYTAFRQGGTKDEKGNVTYTEAEDNAAREALKAAAEALAKATSVDDLKEKIKGLTVNEGSEIEITEEKNQLHTTLTTAQQEWLSADGRKDGDITAIPNTSTTKDEDGKETTITNGYYVIIFNSKTDNSKKMSNVRHLLVKFESGTENETTGEMEYTEAEKTAAKTEAEGYLKTWKEGTANEESFIELVKKNSDDTSAEEGGLFEDIHPDSEYVTSFLEWSISPDRKAGDTDVIESPYGYHVMYYVGDDEMSYRDYMLTYEMKAADMEKWHNGILETVTTSIGNTSLMGLDMVLSNG